MWDYNEIQQSDELYHYGVPGMKWGQRRAQKRAAINRYRSEYNKSQAGKSGLSKAYDKITGADKIYAQTRYNMSKSNPKPKTQSNAKSTKPASKKPANSTNTTKKKNTKKQVSKGKKNAVKTIAKIGKNTAAFALQYKKNQAVENSINKMFDKDLLGAADSAYTAYKFGNAERYIRNL